MKFLKCLQIQHTPCAVLSLSSEKGEKYLKTVSDTIKSIIIIALVIVLGTLASMRLMKIQIVGGDDIVAPNKYASDAIIYEREIVPTRGVSA